MRHIFFLSLFFLTLSGCSKSYEPDSKDIKIAAVQLPPKDEVVYNEHAVQSAPPAPKDKQEIEQKIIKQAQ